jgi:(heptosyl)LPS beta-1,4-glucosyltransferase
VQKLAVVIITLNEERNIGRCLQSVQGLADEIIVLDAFSSDKTQAICDKFNVRFVQRAWEGYAASKNYLNSLCSADYILSLDADEALSEQLYQSILEAKKVGFTGVYSLNRLTNYAGTWIKHSGWFPDIKVRIFPKDRSHWSGEFVHEELIFPTCTPKLLNGVLEHYSYYSYADHRKRADKYSLLTAQKFHAAGKKVGPLKPYISALGRFIAMFIIKLGFLDGWKGFKIAQISALSNILKYKELRRLNREKKHGLER